MVGPAPHFTARSRSRAPQSPIELSPVGSISGLTSSGRLAVGVWAETGRAMTAEAAGARRARPALRIERWGGAMEPLRLAPSRSAISHSMDIRNRQFESVDH